MDQTPISGPLSVSKPSVALWHDEQALRASQRAQNARDAALAYRSPVEGRSALPVAADRQDAVAAAAEAEATFHKAAAVAVLEA